MDVQTLPLPPERLRFMREDDARLIASGRVLVGVLRDHGLGPDTRLLDVGCGYGRLALGLMAEDYRGRYLGFDILWPHVSWCREHLMTDPRYTFRFLHVFNARYNPLGNIPAGQVRFPCPDASQDLVCTFSVFTHMYAVDIRRYLAQMSRVLAPGGTAVTTWFVYDDERLPQVLSARSRYPMVHVLDESTRYANDEDPLHAIGYEEGFVRRLVAHAGLEVESVTRGIWAGDGDPDTFQDLLVLRKPLPLPPARLRSAGESDASLVEGGRRRAALLRAHGMTQDSRVLDVGSGHGVLALGLMATGFRGRYLGLELLRPQVRWCRRQLTADPRYRFRRLDPDELGFPAGDATRDVCLAIGVFDALDADGARRHLAEIRRVLTPGGTAVTTWPATDAARALATRLVTGAGLELRSVSRGGWARDTGSDADDLLVLGRPVPAPPGAARRAAARARAVVRRLRRRTP